MSMTTNHDRKPSWFIHLSKWVIVLCSLLLLAGLATSTAFASSSARSSVSTAHAPNTPFRLKNITSLGVAGPGGISMTSEQVGWAFAANGVQHTSDGGQTWQTVAKSTDQQVIRPLYIFDGQTAWYTTIDTQTFATSALYRTSDGGQS